MGAGRPKRGEVGQRKVRRGPWPSRSCSHTSPIVRVDHRPAQAQLPTAQGGSQEAALDRGDMDHGNPARHRAEQWIDRDIQRRRARQIRRAQAVHSDRRLAERAHRTNLPLHGGAKLHAPVLDRNRAEGDDLISPSARGRSAPGQPRSSSQRATVSVRTAGVSACKRRLPPASGGRSLIARRGSAPRRCASEPTPPPGTPP